METNAETEMKVPGGSFDDLARLLVHVLTKNIADLIKKQGSDEKPCEKKGEKCTEIGGIKTVRPSELKVVDDNGKRSLSDSDSDSDDERRLYHSNRRLESERPQTPARKIHYSGSDTMSGLYRKKRSKNGRDRNVRMKSKLSKKNPNYRDRHVDNEWMPLKKRCNTNYQERDSGTGSNRHKKKHLKKYLGLSVDYAPNTIIKIPDKNVPNSGINIQAKPFNKSRTVMIQDTVSKDSTKRPTNSYQDCSVGILQRHCIIGSSMDVENCGEDVGSKMLKKDPITKKEENVNIETNPFKMECNTNDQSSYEESSSSYKKPIMKESSTNEYSDDGSKPCIWDRTENNQDGCEDNAPGTLKKVINRSVCNRSMSMRATTSKKSRIVIIQETGSSVGILQRSCTGPGINVENCGADIDLTTQQKESHGDNCLDIGPKTLKMDWATNELDSSDETFSIHSKKESEIHDQVRKFDCVSKHFKQGPSRINPYSDDDFGSNPLINEHIKNDQDLINGNASTTFGSVCCRNISIQLTPSKNGRTVTIINSDDGTESKHSNKSYQSRMIDSSKECCMAESGLGIENSDGHIGSTTLKKEPVTSDDESDFDHDGKVDGASITCKKEPSNDQDSNVDCESAPCKKEDSSYNEDSYVECASTPCKVEIIAKDQDSNVDSNSGDEKEANYEEGGVDCTSETDSKEAYTNPQSCDAVSINKTRIVNEPQKEDDVQEVINETTKNGNKYLTLNPGSTRSINSKKRRYDKTDLEVTSKSALQNHFSIYKEDELQQNPRTVSEKASKMWADILKSPELEKTEQCPKRRKVEVDRLSGDSDDYEDMLEDFMNRSPDPHVRQEGKTLYEKRLRERLEHPEHTYLMQEFDISPAKMEVFFCRLTDEMSPVRCLEEVCSLQRWLPPSYSLRPGPRPGTFLASCTVKGVTLSPDQPASNRLLAQGLAASMFLDWLGVVRRDTQKDLDSVDQTYF